MKLVIKLNKEEIEKLSKGEEVIVKTVKKNYEDLENIIVTKGE